ncbi:MAG: NAD(P)/FAD-dependent oxidoreductase [Syntrophotaleaceae bacterium]
MNQPDIIVIGGGAAGMMAAGQSAQAGARTLLLGAKCPARP